MSDGTVDSIEPKAGAGQEFATEYDSAKRAAVVFDRSQRGRLLVSGRAPGQMLGGVLTGRIPSALEVTADPEIHRGARAYSAMLTAKGKMISDLYVYRLPGEDEAFVLDIPAAGLEGVLAHFARVLPPRLARFQDASADYRCLTVAGPAAGGAVSAIIGLPERDARLLSSDSEGSLSPDEMMSAHGTIFARSPDLSVPSFDGLLPTDRWDAALETLSELGIGTARPEVWNALRLEAGTPEFGVDMLENTIPIEAGIDERGIDHEKGCYTGQEVVVRIRHRGHVNRHLRTLVFASTEDAAGKQLFQVGQDKAVGSITSCSWSMDAGGSVALGYVRREVELGSEVRVGSQEGPPATVRERGQIR